MLCGGSGPGSGRPHWEPDPSTAGEEATGLGLAPRWCCHLCLDTAHTWWGGVHLRSQLPAGRPGSRDQLSGCHGQACIPLSSRTQVLSPPLGQATHRMQGTALTSSTWLGGGGVSRARVTQGPHCEGGIREGPWSRLTPGLECEGTGLLGQPSRGLCHHHCPAWPGTHSLAGSH